MALQFNARNGIYVGTTSYGIDSTGAASFTTIGGTTGTFSSTVSASSFSGSGASLTSLPAGNLTGTIPTGVMGSSSLYIGTTAIALNQGTGTITSLTGVSVSGSAGSASQIAITDDVASTAGYIAWVGGTSGNQTQKTSSTKLTFNASTGVLSASGFSGSGSSLSSLTAGNLSGTIPNAVLGNSTVYIGTTAVALNRPTSNISLTGVNIDGSAATVTGAAQTSITSLGTLTGLNISGTLQIGSGSTTSAGITAGYLGTSGLGAVWSTGVTASTTNYALAISATNTYLNGTSSSNLMVGASNIAAASSTGLSVTGTLSASGHVTLEGVTSTGSTGTGKLVFDTSSTLSSPTLITPALGTPASGNLTNCTFPTLNQSTTGTAALATSLAAGTQYSVPYQSAVGVTGFIANSSTPGYILTATATAPSWQAAPVSLPDQTGASGKYLTSSGSAASWASFNAAFQFSGIGVGTAASGTTGEIRATNNITAYYSDRRLKTIRGTIQNALGKVLSLQGILYTNNSVAEQYGYTSQEQQIGVIAQEVQAVQPEAVKPAPFDIGQNADGTEYSLSGQNYLTVQYEKLIPLLIEAIKELNAKVSALS